MTEASLFNLTQPDETPAAADIDAPQTDAAPGHSGSQSLSLYRKYRPQSFDADDLFGQEHIVNTLRNAIALDRIAHAYLFCGPRGTGKTTTARLLAKAVNCLDPDPHQRPCNHCTACRAINRNATTDVIEIDAASNRGIDDIRDLRERVKYAPSQMKTKFYIIDEAHQITGAAANAFLKTLEEPPAHTKFVLATTDPEELLQTIVSRCQRFDFRRINMEAMTACLLKVSAIEGISIDDEAMQIIARHSTGSMRDALGLLDQVAVYRDGGQASDGRVAAQTVRTVLGVSRNERVEKLVAALADRDAAAGLIAINQASEAGDDIRQLGRQLVAYLRILLLERAGGTSDADQVAKELAARFSIDELADLAKRFSDIDYKIKHATFAQLPLEIAIVEGVYRGDHPRQARLDASEPSRREAVAAHPQGGASPGVMESQVKPEIDNPRPSLRDRVRGASQQSRATPDELPKHIVDRGLPTTPPNPHAVASNQQRSPTPSPVPPSFTAPDDAQSVPSGMVTDLSLENLVELWTKIRADVKSVNRRIEALLQQVDPVTINGSVVVLASPYEFHRNRVNSDEARRVIEDVISRLVHQQVRISCVTRDEALALVAPMSQVEEHTPDASSASDESADTSLTEAMPAGVSPMTNTGQSKRQPGAAAEEAENVDLEHSPSTVSSLEDDMKRIEAVKNIFDAEEAND